MSMANKLYLNLEAFTAAGLLMILSVRLRAFPEAGVGNEGGWGNWAIPQSLAKSYGDYIPEGVEERFRSLASVKYPHYPLYKHTSCAVSLALYIPLLLIVL